MMMMMMMWKTVPVLTTRCIVFHLIPSWLFALLVVCNAQQEANFDCNGVPTSVRYIKRGTGKGDCFIWGPMETDYQCCLFCKQRKGQAALLASQLVEPGFLDPFLNYTVRSDRCCCYTKGDIVEGSDRTYYYIP